MSGDVVRVAVNFTAEAEKRGATVNSAVWTASSGSLSGETLTASIASALLTVSGDAVLVCTATLSNGETITRTQRALIETSSYAF